MPKEREPRGADRWAVAEAKSKFSEATKRALSGGPQTITSNGRTAGVIVAAEEWRRKTKRAGNLAEFFCSLAAAGIGDGDQATQEPTAKVNL